MIAIGDQYGYDFTLLRDVEAINKHAMLRTVAKAKTMLGDLNGKTIAVLGLAFKPDTDDMRDAPSLVIIPELLSAGATVKTFDPIAQENAKKILKAHEGITFTDDAYAAVKDADLLMVLTEWNEFKEIDLSKVKELMTGKSIIDGRNIYDPQIVKEIGFDYKGVGR